MEVRIPAGLRENILEKVARLESRKQARRLWALRMATAASCGFFAFFFAMFARELATSEFWSIARLMLTDMREVSAYWQDYAFSLLETLPALEMGLVLLPVTVALLLLAAYGEKIHSGPYGGRKQLVIS